MKIVAIDPATVTGIARYDDGEFSFAVHDFAKSRKTSLGDALLALHNVLDKACEDGVDLVVLESPTPVNVRSAKAQFGYVAAIVMWCARHNVPYFEYNVSTVRAWTREWIRGNLAPKRVLELSVMVEGIKQAKRDAVMYAHERHGEFFDHNIADAAALLGIAMHEQGVYA